MRLEQAKNYLANGVFAACPSYLEGLVATINAGEVQSVTITDVSPTHSYEEQGNLAIISVDGAMTKKNTQMNALCGGFTSYDILGKYIDQAEQNGAIDTIIFNVDTVGGDVAGADAIGEQIYASQKKTVTFFNNIGASAGIWIFSAADEIYANETAMVGSIGVIAGYRNSESGSDGQVTLVSKNAQNKNCALNGDCTDRLQSRIDKIEEIFYARVSRNTGFSAEEIASIFGNGGVIPASDALSAGFLKGITTFSSLLKTVATMPMLGSERIVSNSQEGASMELNQENFDAMLAANTDLQAQVTSLTDQVQAVATTTQAEFDAALEGAKVAAKEEAAIRVQEAIQCGVSAEVAVAMLEANSPAEASLLALRASMSSRSTPQVDGNEASAEATALSEIDKLKAYANQNKGRIQ